MAAPKFTLVNPVTGKEFHLVKVNAIVQMTDKIVVADVYQDGDVVVLSVHSTLAPEPLDTIITNAASGNGHKK